MDWNVFKRDHGSTDCWTKQHDAGGEGGKGAGLASVEDVFDITALDKDEENEWQEVFRGRSRTSSSRLPTSAPTPRGWEWIEQRQARAHHDGSGAAESVILLDTVAGGANHVRSSPGSRAETHYIAASGGRMPSFCEKHVEFRTGDGLSSSLLFKLTDTRKPFASVSKIVKKGNWGCLGAIGATSTTS